MVTSAEEINKVITKKNIENIFFKKFIRNISSTTFDEKVHHLYPHFNQSEICVTCANCCKKFEPGIETDELLKLAQLAGKNPIDFKNEFVAFDGDALYLKNKPCVFLNNCKCSIYNSRPAACADYPHLNQTQLKYKRSLWTNYQICPIVFNVIEALKIELNFIYHD